MDLPTSKYSAYVKEELRGQGRAESNKRGINAKSDHQPNSLCTQRGGVMVASYVLVQNMVQAT
jgi:hypothetical protein